MVSNIWYLIIVELIHYYNSMSFLCHFNLLNRYNCACTNLSFGYLGGSTGFKYDLSVIKQNYKPICVGDQLFLVREVRKFLSSKSIIELNSSYLCVGFWIFLNRYYGGWAATNIFFLGFSGVVKFGNVRIGGLSGIYKPQHYLAGIFKPVSCT